MRKVVFAIVFIFLVNNLLLAEDYYIYMSTPSAYVMSLGGAGLFVDKDPSAVLNNPALVNEFERLNISYSNYDYLDFDNKVNIFSLSTKFWDKLYFGFNFHQLDSQDIPITTYSPSIIDYSDMKDNLYVFTLGMNNNNFKWGLNLKYYKNKFISYEADGFNIDFGFNYDLANNFKLAFVVENILNTSLKYNVGGSYKFKPQVKTGVAFRFNKLTTNFSIFYNEYTKLDFSLGLEYKFTPSIYFRMGKNINNDLTTGLGIRVKKGLFIDLAWEQSDFGDTFAVSSRFALSDLFEFTNKKKEKRKNNKKLRRESIPSIESQRRIYKKAIVVNKGKWDNDYQVRVDSANTVDVDYRDVEKYVNKLKNEPSYIVPVTSSKVVVNNQFLPKNEEINQTLKKIYSEKLKGENSVDNNKKLSQDVKLGKKDISLDKKNISKEKIAEKKIVSKTTTKMESLDLDNIFSTIRKLMADGNYQQAARVLEEASRKQPNNIRILKKLAGIYQYLGQDLQAINLYRKLVVLNPDDLDNYISLAYELFLVDRKDEAKKVCLTIINKAPNSPQAQTARSLLTTN